MAEAFYTGAKPVGETELKTTGFDARFPNQNQTKNCWHNYVDFYKCVKLKGEGYAPCQQFLTTFKQICPNAWVEKWDEQREEGVFPHKDLL